MCITTKGKDYINLRRQGYKGGDLGGAKVRKGKYNVIHFNLKCNLGAGDMAQ